MGHPAVDAHDFMSTLEARAARAQRLCHVPEVVRNEGEKVYLAVVLVTNESR
jgi:hypothetical protein